MITDAAKLALLDVAAETRLSSEWYRHPHRTLAAFHEYMRGRRTLVVGEPHGSATTASFSTRTLKSLRRAVKEFAARAGMDRRLVASLVLSVSEIAANSVEHGAGHGTVTMWSEAGEVGCEIVDPGGGPLDDPLPGYIPPEPESLRGYGLWISRQLCDHVSVRAGGVALRVRLHMKL